MKKWVLSLVRARKRMKTTRIYFRFLFLWSFSVVMLKFSDSAVLRGEGMANTRRKTVITISSNLSCGCFFLPLFDRAKKFISKMKGVMREVE